MAEKNISERRMYKKVAVDMAVLLAEAVFIIFILPKLAGYFLPFILGLVVSLIANPIVKFMERRIKIVRKYSTVILMLIVIGVIILLMYVFGAFVYEQVYKFARNSPEIYNYLFSNGDNVFMSGYELIFSTDVLSGGNIMKIIKKAMSVMVFLLFLILSAYFFIADRDAIIGKVTSLLPESYIKEYKMIIANFKKAVSGYFIAQFKIMLILIGVIFFSLLLLGVENAFIISLGIGVLDFLPIFGTGAVLIPWAIYSVIMNEYYLAAGFIVLYLICLVLKQAIEPKILGDSLGMNSFLTLFLLYIGYQIGGFIGVILAIPTGVIIINLWRAGAFNNIFEDFAFILDKIAELRKKQR